MTWSGIRNALKEFFDGAGAEEAGEGISRRSVLTGLGLAGACAVAGPALFWTGQAEADMVQVQYRGRDRDHRGRGHHRGSRHSREDIRRRCRDWRYRSRNERLCAYARGRRGRRGSCVNIGPISICD